jgi:hypothetical protein
MKMVIVIIFGHHDLFDRVDHALRYILIEEIAIDLLIGICE